MNIGQKLWFGFGDGKGYQKQMLAFDATVSVSITLIEGAAWAQNLTSNYSLETPGWMGIAPLLTLTGPIVHAAHGRIAPALVSLVGWAAVSFIAAVLPLTYALSREGGEGPGRIGGPRYDEAPFAAGENLVASVLGSTAMTLLDVWMARGF